MAEERTEMLDRLIELLPLTGYEGVGFPRLFVALLAASTLLDLVIADRLLFRGGGRVHLGRVLLAVAVLGLLFPVKALVLRYFHFGPFGLMTVLWYDLILVAPWCALRAVARCRRGGASGGVMVVAAAALLFLPVAGYARWIEPEALRVETVHVPLPAARTGMAPLRVVVLADLQTDRVGRYEREVFARIAALEPDLVLVPGDLFQGAHHLLETVIEPLRALLGGLSAPGGVYFTRGDVDPPVRIDPLLAGLPIRFLKDEIEQVTVKGHTVTICGLERNVTTAVAQEIVARCERLPGAADVRLLVAHRPEAVRLLSEHSRVDLTIAGHTHGGQVVLPFFGPPLTLCDLPRQVAAGGLHTLDGNRIYVSRGVGHERSQAPRVRFLAPPELTLLLIGGPVDS